MPSLFETINDDIKAAMKARRAEELAALRMLLSALKNRRIEVIGSEAGELSDQQVIEVVASEMKKRKDSFEAYEQGNRPDLAGKEKAEMEILVRYLPAQLSPEETEAAVRRIAAGLGEAGPADFGRVMGLAMKELKGKADGNLVGEITKKILAGEN